LKRQQFYYIEMYKYISSIKIDIKYTFQIDYNNIVGSFKSTI